jgi:hypothetical protein
VMLSLTSTGVNLPVQSPRLVWRAYTDCSAAPACSGLGPAPSASSGQVVTWVGFRKIGQLVPNVLAFQEGGKTVAAVLVTFAGMISDDPWVTGAQLEVVMR